MAELRKFPGSWNCVAAAAGDIAADEQRRVLRGENHLAVLIEEFHPFDRDATPGLTRRSFRKESDARAQHIVDEYGLAETHFVPTERGHRGGLVKPDLRLEA